jgi:hypothetical protein
MLFLGLIVVKNRVRSKKITESLELIKDSVFDSDRWLFELLMSIYFFGSLLWIVTVHFGVQKFSFIFFVTFLAFNYSE